MKNQKGITLISLVITIIILIILAGISISLLIGKNGLIAKVTGAVELSKIGEEKDYLGLSFFAAKTNKLGDKVTKEDFEKELSNYVDSSKFLILPYPDKFEVIYTDSGRKYTVNQDGTIQDNIVQIQDDGIYAKLYEGGVLVISDSKEPIEGRNVIKDYDTNIKYIYPK